MMYNVFKGLQMLKNADKYGMTTSELSAKFMELGELSKETSERACTIDGKESFDGTVEEIQNLYNNWLKFDSYDWVHELLDGFDYKHIIEGLKTYLDSVEEVNDTMPDVEFDPILALTMNELHCVESQVDEYIEDYVKPRTELSPELEAAVRRQLMNYTAYVIVQNRD